MILMSARKLGKAMRLRLALYREKLASKSTKGQQERSEASLAPLESVKPLEPISQKPVSPVGLDESQQLDLPQGALEEINQIVSTVNQRMRSLSTEDIRTNAQENLDRYLERFG